MFKTQDFEKLWYRYKSEGEPNSLSIERYCMMQGVPYQQFEKWFRSTRKEIQFTTSQKLYMSLVKRPIGFLGALVALILLSPIFICTIVFLHFANKGAGIFFTQDRPGKDGKIFKVIKFKSMTDERDADGKLLPDADRLTKVGKFVRATSIDELPQLINILKGDMSLIGPRPLLPEYLWVFDDFQKRRHEVRPGITGWAQVHGRNHCKLSKKFELDVWYVDHCTLAIDIKIIFMTIKNVLLHEDIGEGAGDMKDIDDLNMGARMNAIREQKKAEE